MARIVPPGDSMADADDLSDSFDGESSILESSAAGASPMAPREKRSPLTIIDIDAADSLVLFDTESAPSLVTEAASAIESSAHTPTPPAVISHAAVTTTEYAPSWGFPWTRFALGGVVSVCVLAVFFLSTWRGTNDASSTSSVEGIDSTTRTELRPNIDAVAEPNPTPVPTIASAIDDQGPDTRPANQPPTRREPVPAPTVTSASSPARAARANRSQLEAPAAPPMRAATRAVTTSEDARRSPPVTLESSVQNTALPVPPTLPADRDRPVPATLSAAADRDQPVPATLSAAADRDRPVPATLSAVGSAVPPSSAAVEAPVPPPSVAVREPVVRSVATVEQERLRQDEDGIQLTLRRYQLAYEQMDASAAQRVWPTVDVRALSRAFDSLQSQEINFHHCDLRVAGKNAQASCKGSGTFVPRVGSRDPRTVQREWSFQLEKVNDAWMIARTEIR